jgi:D-aminopeptidase
MHANVTHHGLLQDLHRFLPMLEMVALQKGIGRLAVVHLPQCTLVDKASRAVERGYDDNRTICQSCMLIHNIALPGHHSYL